MKVFTEYHHGGLFHALQMLIEGRLGGQLFCQTGYEWADEGYWNINDLPTTKIQYLDPKESIINNRGISLHFDKSEEIFQKRITLEDFKNTKFDYIICTLQNHQVPFRELRDKYQPQAKLIRLCGNWGEQLELEGYDGFIDTTALYSGLTNLPYVNIHQEFPMKPFYYEEPKNHKTIKNFMNCLKENPIIAVWEYYRNALPEYTFKMHGGNGDDGSIVGLQNLADSIRDSSFIFQIKHAGEGYGHVIHNAYACGRPAIVLHEYYSGKIADCFLHDEVSAIFVDDLTPQEAVAKIVKFSEPERHIKMCENAYELFKENVDFDFDEAKFRAFLSSIS